MDCMEGALLNFAAITDTLKEVASWLPGILAALVAGGLLTLVVTRWFERTSERRKLYANAYKTVMAWQEMLYRVRRRASGIDEERKLIDRFHDLQEEINYYQGLVSSEGKSMGKSYKKFVGSMKRANVDLIQLAWEAPIRKPKDGTPKDEEHPNPNKIAEDFLQDSRQWLAWWQLPKIFVWWRNKK